MSTITGIYSIDQPYPFNGKTPYTSEEGLSQGKNLKRKFSYREPLSPQVILQLPSNLELLEAREGAWQLQSDKDIEAFTGRIKRLKSLDIRSTYEDLSTDHLTKVLRANTEITDLFAGYSQLDPSGLNALSRQSVKSLSVCDCKKLSPVNLVDFLKQNPQLKSLELTSDLAVPAVAYAIAQYCPQLEVLEISWGETLSEEHLIEIASHCTKLKKIRFPNLIAFSDSACITFLEKCKELQKIDASGTSISDLSLARVNELHIPLTFLDVSSCKKITCKGLEEVLRVGKDSLRVLGLNLTLDKRIVDLLCTYHPPLTCFSLTTLYERFGDLVVTCPPTAEDLLKIITALSQPISKLKVITLWYFEEITYETLEQIVKLCPELKLINISTGQIRKIASSRRQEIEVFRAEFKENFDIELWEPEG